MSPSERLKLASFILSDLVQSELKEIDFEDSWSEEDLRDLTAYVADHFSEAYPGEDEFDPSR
jgi:hypothetical protein